MPNIDPKVIFWISVIIAVAGVGSNSAIWSGAVPGDIIPMLAQWNRILSSVGQVIMPLLLGQGMTVQGRIAAAAPLAASDKIALAASSPEVQQIVTTRAIAQAAGPDGDGAKVVSKS